jgi:hypothetical protein
VVRFDATLHDTEAVVASAAPVSSLGYPNYARTCSDVAFEFVKLIMRLFGLVEGKERDLLTDCCSVWVWNSGVSPAAGCLTLVELLQLEELY